MGLETVKDEILSNANKQAGFVIAEAKKEADRILKEAEKKAELMKEHAEARTKKRIELMKKQELTSAELDNRKMLLEAKKQAVENVFAEARARIEKLDDAQREAHLKKLFDKIKKDIEPVHIYCSKRDHPLLKAKAETAGIIGGLIAENNDKTVRVDYSFETLLQSVKDNEMQEINKILFG